MLRERAPHFLLALILGAAGIAEPALCGLMTSAGLKWQIASFRPEAEEPTPNYYGYGLLFNLGYSAGKVFDFAIYGSYVPVQLKTANVTTDQAVYYEGGAELGFRIVQAVYLGFKYGLFHFDLKEQKLATEVPGTWSGPGGSVILAGFWDLKRDSYLQFGVEAGSAVVARKDEDAAGKRIIDTYGVTMTYLFNATDTFDFIGGNHISDFLNSLSF